MRASTALLLKQLQGFSRYQPASVMHQLHWANYSAKAIAQIQARGMQIDMQLWNLVQENKAAVIELSAADVRPELWHRQSDLHAGRPLERRPVRAMARQRRRDGMAAP